MISPLLKSIYFFLTQLVLSIKSFSPRCRSLHLFLWPSCELTNSDLKKKKSLILLYENYLNNYHFFPKTNLKKKSTGSQQKHLQRTLSPGLRLTEHSSVSLPLLHIFLLLLHCPNWRKSNKFIVFCSFSSRKTKSQMKSFHSLGFHNQIFAKCTASFLACVYSIQDFQVIPLSNYPSTWAIISWRCLQSGIGKMQYYKKHFNNLLSNTCFLTSFLDCHVISGIENLLKLSFSLVKIFKVLSLDSASVIFIRTFYL